MLFSIRVPDKCPTCYERKLSDFCGRCLARRVMKAQTTDPGRRVYSFACEPSKHWKDALAER